MEHNIIIIGGGPIGLACGLAAQKAGIDYLILEKGCLVNSLFNYPLNMTFFSTSEKLEIGGIPFVSNNVKPTRPEALEYYRRISHSNKLNIHLFEEVLSVAHSPETTVVTTTKNEYTARHVIIATGFYDIPVLLNIPGERLPKVSHYYRDPHYYAEQKVVIVGANNSAVDAALETYRKGAHVTMVIRGSEITERVKYWAKPDIENRIKNKEIKAFFNAHLVEIRETEVDIETPDGRITIENDFVLAMTGYRPNFQFLEKTGIRFAEDGKLTPIHNTETQETNLQHIYLAGVVCGGLNTRAWFIENSIIHAEKIIAHILSGGATSA